MTGLVGLAIVIISAVLLAVIVLTLGRIHPSFRKIAVFSQAMRFVRYVAEDGTRIHFSVGNGDTLTQTGSSGLVGLAVIRRLGDFASLSDRPPIATSGNGVLNLLTTDVLQSANDFNPEPEPFRKNSVRVTGLSPMAYTAGVLPTIRDEKISSNIMIGNFGPEIGLIVEAAARQNAGMIAASDNLTAQSVLFASMKNTPPIGEELYAAGAYTESNSFHTASLLLQDIFRWLIILALLVGAALKLAGLL